MVPVMSLWLPTLLSAVVAFLLSSLIHMLLKYHQSDFDMVPKEDEVMDALRPFNIPPGNYAIPRAGSMEAMKSPEFIEKANKGPVGFMTVFPNGVPAMGASLIKWFIYCIVVSAFAAYVGGRALGPGAEYLSVFRFVGTTAFIGYSLALWQNTIWYKTKLSTTIKNTFDGLVYALFTAGVFGWLWPS